MSDSQTARTVSHLFTASPRVLLLSSEMVIAGALLGIAATWLFDTSFGMHVWLSVVYSVLIAFPIYIIVALDNPYRGRVSVNPEALVRAYEH